PVTVPPPLSAGLTSVIVLPPVLLSVNELAPALKERLRKLRLPRSSLLVVLAPAKTRASPAAGGALPPVQLSGSSQLLELLPVQVSVAADACCGNANRSGVTAAAAAARIVQR